MSRQYRQALRRQSGSRHNEEVSFGNFMVHRYCLPNIKYNYHTHITCLQQQSLRENIYQYEYCQCPFKFSSACVLKRFQSFSKLYYVYCHIGLSNIRVIPKLKYCPTVISILFFLKIILDSLPSRKSERKLSARHPLRYQTESSP